MTDLPSHRPLRIDALERRDRIELEHILSELAEAERMVVALTYAAANCEIVAGLLRDLPSDAGADVREHIAKAAEVATAELDALHDPFCLDDWSSEADAATLRLREFLGAWYARTSSAEG